jgi:predicted amidohydrolase YtcJ
VPYAFRSLLGGGAPVAYGSGIVSSRRRAAEGIYAAVTRRTLDGARPGGWVPAERITVEEALRAYTAPAPTRRSTTPSAAPWSAASWPTSC